MTFRIFSFLGLAAALVSCDYESFEDETALTGLEFQDPFVRIITGGADGMAEATVGEADTVTMINVESRSISGGDITVEYSLGGTAEYGTVYTIPGASASGGTLLIPFDDGTESTAPRNADIRIDYLVDTLMTAPQTIEITLTSASSSDGSGVTVGQGPLRQSLEIELVND